LLSTKDTSSSIPIRNRFPKLEITVNIGGNKVVKYPFLELKSIKDLMLLRYLAGTTPYKAGYGKTTEAWETLCTDLKTKCFDDNGAQVFSSTLTVRLIKDRFKEYISFIKKYNSQVPFRSGNDDEETYEILQLAEQLYEDYTSYELEKDNKKAAENQKVNADLAAAAELRNASLGNLQRISKKVQSDSSGRGSGSGTSSGNETDNSTESHVNKKERQKKLKAKEYAEEKERTVKSYSALLQHGAIREERMKIKEENRKELLKIRSIEAAAREKEAANREKEMAHREKEMEFLKYVVGMVQKKKKKRKHVEEFESDSDEDDDDDTSLNQKKVIEL
jgi:hypothetical protein